MKRKLQSAIYCTLLLIAATSCTQNNGDISPWFGYWRMTALTIDGEPDPAYDGMISWSFQNNIVSINTYDIHHTYSESYGTWSCDDKTLSIDYTHSDGQGDKAYLYTAPAIMRIPADRPVDFEIVSQSGRRTILRRTLPDTGEVMECVLTKP